MDELQKHAVSYINSDSNARGFWRASGSHDLENFINDVARDVNDPEKNISVWQRAKLARIASANTEDRGELRKRANLRIRALGDGSDYAPFLDHAGVSALNLGFGGEADGDSYHSIYDDFAWYTRFMDPDFVYGRVLAQTAGTAMMRLADSDIIPYDYTAMADTIARYEGELEKQLKEKQDEINERNLQIKEGVFSATADPKKTSVPPPHEEVPPYMNFAPLKNALEPLKQSADRYATAMGKLDDAKMASLSAEQLDRLDADLIRIQRAFLTEKGLPERPWFKHQVYAPGAYTGYGAKPIAAVREYMDQKKWKEAEAQVPMVADVLANATAAINHAAEDVEAVGGK
jgi:N-acetylated-alpha-linked acidic dipeptidase